MPRGVVADEYVSLSLKLYIRIGMVEKNLKDLALLSLVLERPKSPLEANRRHLGPKLWAIHSGRGFNARLS